MHEPDNVLDSMELVVIFDSSPIDEFASEATQGPKPGPARGGVPLQDVVSSGTSIGWEDAVALVEELCALLLPEGSGPTEAAVPSLEGIFIGADGAVSWTIGGSGEEGPVAAGRLLHALLGSGDVPMALRLFVTQSTGSATHGSLREFATGLRYFGKPGRTERIQAIYARYVTASASSARALPKPALPPPVPSRVPAPRAHEPAPTFTPPRRKKKAPAWLLPAAAIVGLVSVFWLWSWDGSVEGVEAEASESAGMAANSEDAFLDRVPLDVDPLGASGHGVGPETGAAAAQLAMARTVPTGTSAASAVRAPSPVVAPPQVRSATPAPASASATVKTSAPLVRQPAPSDATSVPAALPPAAAAAPVRTVTLPRPSSSDAVYSSADADVQPPVLLEQQMPSPLLTVDPERSTMNRMELLVSAEGLVESAHMIAGPGRMPDMMLLSGAKNWKFTPAVKDGEAVRYRAVFSWAAFP